MCSFFGCLFVGVKDSWNLRIIGEENIEAMYKILEMTSVRNQIAEANGISGGFLVRLTFDTYR